MTGQPQYWPGPCSAPHVYQRRPGAVQLVWHAAPRFERCRVVAWTCADHDGPWYELCRSGGQWFIQAMKGDPLKPTILHSRVWREDEAQRIWAALLFGVVR